MVDVECVARAEDGDDNRQAHRRFSRSYHHYKEDEDLSAHLMPLVSEGDKRQVYGIQHQLDRHKDGDDVALDQECRHANRKKDSAQHQVISNRDDHLAQCSLLASATAPRMATRISTDVTSNGSSRSRKSTRLRSLVVTR